MKVDVHNHAIPRTVLEALRRDDAYGVTIAGDRWHGGVVGDFTVAPGFFSAEQKLRDLEAGGMDGAVLSVAPMIFCYHVGARPAEALAREANRGLAEMCAERLGLTVMLHPPFGADQPGLAPYYLENVIGHLLETTIAAERLICSRTLDRHPGVRVVLVHGGGYVPYQLGRLRHARAVRRELAAAPQDPWSYAGRLVCDTITHDREALRYLVGIA